MGGILLDYSDITDIFKEKLQVDNIVKKISSIFLNKRYAAKIDYKPYFQRNYVWDSEKASYFIESILLGTDIPPLVFFQTRTNNEVIDGRQRYETIERFLQDRFALNAAGLRSLTGLAGKRYSQLGEDIQEKFEDTRIRILQFKVVNEPRLEDEKEDKIKKEIFRRYNSGITPLGKADIERASYISDPISSYFSDEIKKDKRFFQALSNLFLPVSKMKTVQRDQINYLMMQIRTLLVIPFIPIYSYAQSSSKQEVVNIYYTRTFSDCLPDEEYQRFVEKIYKLENLRKCLEEKKHFLSDSKLFFEVAFWGLSILDSKKINLSDADIKHIADEITNNYEKEEYWCRIINNPTHDLGNLFEVTGSHYYSSINNRYNFVANVLGSLFDVNFAKNLKNSESFKSNMKSKTNADELKHYRLNKAMPETLTIEDIISDMVKNRFMIRPKYQRSEVKNLQKASYLMESILLGINIPPIFVYKRSDKIKEVVDGQQRLLAILGFLGKTYKDENGNFEKSHKDSFKLTKLRILKELNGKSVDTIPDEFIDKILEFPIDVIEIDQDLNPDFSQTDLFARLNTKPYPIRENTFEMWNAYIDKDIILKIREIADRYEGSIFRAKDTRMKVEELVTSLAYLDYCLSDSNSKSKHPLNVYKKNDRFYARISSKDNVTSTLSELSIKNRAIFIQSIESVDTFVQKVEKLIGNDPAKLKELFSHSRKGTQCKTDQNFYFLWLMLRKLELETITENKDAIFKIAAQMFSKIQKSPDAYTPECFFKDLDDFDVAHIGN